MEDLHKQLREPCIGTPLTPTYTTYTKHWALSTYLPDHERRWNVNYVLLDRTNTSMVQIVLI